MEVVVQNGANHCLSRAEVEKFTPLFPSSWSAVVEKILLARGGLAPVTAFYPKAKELCLSCSIVEGEANKAEAVVELLVALAAIKEKGILPQKLNTSFRKQLELATLELKNKCLERLYTCAT